MKADLPKVTLCEGKVPDLIPLGLAQAPALNTDCWLLL